MENYRDFFLKECPKIDVNYDYVKNNHPLINNTLKKTGEFEGSKHPPTAKQLVQGWQQRVEYENAANVNRDLIFSNIDEIYNFAKDKNVSPYSLIEDANEKQHLRELRARNCFDCRGRHKFNEREENEQKGKRDQNFEQDVKEIIQTQCQHFLTEEDLQKQNYDLTPDFFFAKKNLEVNSYGKLPLKRKVSGSNLE